MIACIAKDALYLTRIRTILDRTLMRNAILLTVNSERSDAEHHTNEYNELKEMEGGWDRYLKGVDIHE